MAALTIEFPQTVWTVEFGGDEIVVAEVTMTGGTGGGFDGEHNDLDGRSTADAHPISAITGLTAALEAGGASALADLTDVDVETDPPAPDDVLAWDGTNWTPATLDGGSGLELGETSSTAYRGDRGKTAYDHSQLTTGNPHGTTAGDVGAAPSSHAHAGSDITSGLVPAAVLGTGGSGAGTKFLADDQTFKTPPSLGAVLSNVTLTGTQTTISFTSIPSTYTHLVIVFQGRSNAAGIATTAFRMTLNNDTGSNYNGQYVGGNNASAIAAIQSAAAFGYLGNMPAANATTGYSMSGSIEIPNYAGTTFFKNALFQTTRDENGSGANMVTYRGHIVWKSTSAINRLDLIIQYGDFIAGSRFTLYGIV